MSDSTLLSVQKEWMIDQGFVDVETKQIDFMQVLNKALEVSELHDQHLQEQLNTHFIKEDQSWVITQYEINIFDELAVGDTIHIDTRLIEVNKFVCVRRYSVMRNDQLVCEIFGKFAAIDLKKRRIVRINLEPLVSADIIDSTYMVGFAKLKPFSDEVDENAIQIPITEADIDENLHVNNLSYFKWVIKNLPGEIVDKYKAVKIEVKYEKELLPEDDVVMINHIDIINQRTSQHLIWNQTNKQLACILNIKWEERSL
ncbi:acyl-ACP thioesterase domain-containing protein [Aerococcaceae bacterium WGS1372]